MTRRAILGFAAAAEPLLAVPVRIVTDTRAACTVFDYHRWNAGIWPEAVRDFRRGGIQLMATPVEGEIKRSPAGRPQFAGLARGAVNLVITGRVPMDWDNGRGLAGVSTRHEGYALSVIALQQAHPHRVPFLSVNTCVHELLHVLFGDVFVKRPDWAEAGAREWRIDWVATGLWLFHRGGGLRERAAACLQHL